MSTFSFPLQVKKTWGATLTTLQDMTVLDDYDVSQSFTHSPSSESVKSSVSDGYLNKPSLAKRRANQQETELFYFTVREQRSLMFIKSNVAAGSVSPLTTPAITGGCGLLHL